MTARWTFDGAQDEPALRLRMLEAHGDVLSDLARLSPAKARRVCVAGEGPRPHDEMWISRDARVSGELDIMRDRSARGTVALETRDTALLLSLEADVTGKLDGTTLGGRVSVHDALLLGLFETPLQPLPEGSAELESRVVGSWSSPKLRGRIRSGPLRVDAGADLVLELDRSRTRFVFDEEAFVYRDLVVEAYGGSLSGDGVVGFTEAFAGYDAELTLREIRVQDLPLDRKGECRVGRLLRGTLSGKLHLQRRDEQTPMRGSGDLTIDEPEYPVVAQLGPRVKELGLPLPKSAGTRPLTATLRLADGGLAIERLEATLDG
ncbi:MAG: hypothetical protein RIF41_27160, partial [Polyangiaceae bacterium]